MLSGVILLGSGVSLGVGLIEARKAPDLIQSFGLEEPSLLPVEPSKSKINLNKSSSTELEFLSGIGPAKARAIVDYRESYGPFKTTAEIMNVSGIGPQTYEKIKSGIVVE